jgi:hypothetical protein
VTESDIRDVIALNKMRMSGKNKLVSIDEKKINQILTHVKENGLVCIARIDNQICAGAICFRTGKNYFMTVVAHDPTYDSYGLGKLCCKHLICECIDQDGKEFHFLWGRYEYKFSLAGVQRDLYEIVIYRSKIDTLVHLNLAFKIWLHARKRQAILHLQNIKKTNGVLSRLMTYLLSTIRRN